MSKKIEGTPFFIEESVESDCSFIVQGQVEIAWFRLGPEHQKQVSRQSVEEQVKEQMAKLRQDSGFPNVVFVARIDDGTPIGFVWVAKTHNDFTGQLEASLLNQYVDEAYRGQGVGKHLMETAEAWARKQGLPRISLSVGIRNRLGQELYATLGYHIDILRMTKTLSAQAPDESLVGSNY